jgi:hypothetical protein
LLKDFQVATSVSSCRPVWHGLVLGWVFFGGTAGSALADFFSFKHLGEKKLLHGNPLAQYADGVLLVEGPDLQHYAIEPADLLDWKDKGKAVKPWGKDQLRAELKKSFGADFYVQMTSHYAIVYNTDVAFARQAGTLLERTYSVFRSTFANRGAFAFEDLRQPLVAVVLKSREEYLTATKEELGQTLAWSAGMYAQNTNRFYMYDAYEGNLEQRKSVALTNVRGASSLGGSGLDRESIEVIVHEGTHQLAFNFGIHDRHAHTPVWFIEGLATYFEAADPKSAEGWARAGNINPHRLGHLQSIFGSMPKGILNELATRDQLFYDTKTNGDAYSLSWALTYYLMKTKGTAYIRYLRIMKARGLMPMDERSRLEDFRKAFGTTPAGLEDDFRRYMVGVFAAQAKGSVSGR